MKSKQSFWQRIGLHDFFLKKEADRVDNTPPSLTPNNVYRYIIEKFRESIEELSFADRVVFYHEYIICLNPEDYHHFMENKKGIFGIIVHESLKKFYDLLKEYRGLGKTVEPSASRWIFRFVSHPDYARGDISFIGKLLPDTAPNTQSAENLRVTFIPRQTGIAQTFDINPDILKGFHFYSEGYYEVPYREDLVYDERQVKAPASVNALARFETIIPDKEFAGKKIEYFMRDEEITVTGKEEKNESGDYFKIPSDWVNSPHLRIRYNKNENKFYLASFGEKTVLNERDVLHSSEANPQWIELPFNSRILLNGIVGVNIFKP
ncbi:FHA domain-containing protein [Flavisolibacter nicotianae]|uniref:hypothetical protein n=1 Tax=Flavisolibacter nicotianae TaxID=2364882 RepID=UPI000EAB5E77|nr:hypothetical protein [Flavisolibacter nicotianae]